MSTDTHRFFAGKQILVLGCGYIGSAVARQALIKGLVVTALTRNPAKAAVLVESGIQVIGADLAGSDWHARVPDTVEYVLNCVSSGGGGIEGYRQSYLAGMQSVLAWAQRAMIGTFVYTGSTSVYPQDGGITVDETAATDTVNERVRLLVETENLIRSSTSLGRWFILRLAGIYGPGRHHVLDQLRTGSPLPGSGAHRLNLAHRDDICAAIWSAFSAPDQMANQIFNVVDDAPVPKVELVNWLAARLGLPLPYFDVSAQPSRRPVPPDRLVLNTKLKQLLGWQPAFPDFRAGYIDLLKSL